MKLLRTLTVSWRVTKLIVMAVFLFMCISLPAWSVNNGNLYELIQNKTVEVSVSGNGTESVIVKVRRKVAEPVTVLIAAGTFFVCGNVKLQNMVAVRSKDLLLENDEWQVIYVPTYSTDCKLKIPDSKDLYAVQLYPNNGFNSYYYNNRHDLNALQLYPDNAAIRSIIQLMVKDNNYFDFKVEIYAYWINISNATYKFLRDNYWFDEKNYPGTPYWNEYDLGKRETISAMRYCAKAGIDLTKKAIWSDRNIIFPEKKYMSDIDLMEYLIGYNSTGVIVVSTTPLGAKISIIGESTTPLGATIGIIDDPEKTVISPYRLTVECNAGKQRKVIILAQHEGYLSKYVNVTVTSGINTPCDLTLRFVPEGTKIGAKYKNPQDSAVMVWVPAGEFPMGSNDNVKDYHDDEKPQRRIYLDGYWIYKTEVTVAQYRKFCQATGWKMPEEPKWKWQDSYPIVNINWYDANAYADWAGVKLPTEAQWEKAARWTDGRIYPWGNEWDISKCVNNNNIKPVGSIVAGESPYGCLDMAGNASEWCIDSYCSYYYSIAPSRNTICTDIFSNRNRVIRGGSNDIRSAHRDNNNPYEYSDNIGFRCVLPAQNDLIP
jgi:formylglycine-generating enzyme required for sulfatase activity